VGRGVAKLDDAKVDYQSERSVRRRPPTGRKRTYRRPALANPTI